MIHIVSSFGLTGNGPIVDGNFWQRRDYYLVFVFTVSCNAIYTYIFGGPYIACS